MDVKARPKVLIWDFARYPHQERYIHLRNPMSEPVYVLTMMEPEHRDVFDITPGEFILPAGGQQQITIERLKPRGDNGEVEGGTAKFYVEWATHKFYEPNLQTGEVSIIYGPNGEDNVYGVTINSTYPPLSSVPRAGDCYRPETTVIRYRLERAYDLEEAAESSSFAIGATDEATAETDATPGEVEQGVLEGIQGVAQETNVVKEEIKKSPGFSSGDGPAGGQGGYPPPKRR